MDFSRHFRRLVWAALTGGAIALGSVSIPITLGALSPAAAQISEDAQVALEEYGSWRPHPRLGQVWVPRQVPPDWRPYSYGHWVYTDEWGWYWVSDDVEADWGWVVYHYGRWAFERGFGWYWVPGDEWAPAWVDWRYGEGDDAYVGWAPLPPDGLMETYEIEPTYWVFVPGRYITAPRLRAYYVPVNRRMSLLRSTRVVNRTFAVRGSRLGVNPGISPAFVARVTRAPVTTFRVQPRVFASTQGVAGAVPVHRDDLRGGRSGPGGAGGPGGRARLGAVSVQPTTAVIQPGAAAVAPQPLNRNEGGRLGSHPPRAAQGTPSVVPAQQPSAAPPAGLQRQAPAIQQQTPAVQQQTPAGTPPPPPPGPNGRPSTAAPVTNAPVQQQERREEHRERGPGAPAGSPPPQQPNIVRPIPPQASPPPPPPQRQVQPPPPPPPPQERQVRPPPPPPPPQQRQVQPPPPAAAPPPQRPAAPPPAAARPAPQKPAPKPGEKPPDAPR